MPTVRGWLAAGVFTAAVLVSFAVTIHPFLAMSNGQPGGALVIEGWGADWVIEEAVKEYQRGSYERIYVTGGPIEFGAPLSEYKTYAARGAAVAEKFGIAADKVIAVPAPAVAQDRTYASAVSLGEYLRTNGTPTASIHLFTDGAHARRSRLLFERAMRSDVKVSVTAVAPRNYDPRRWWASSSGVRGVVGELLAYAYVRLLFRP